MSLSSVYSTLEEHIESLRSLQSPLLQKCGPNFDTLDTPPPLVDAPDNYNSESASLGISEGIPQGNLQPSLYDSLLIRSLGPSYPSDIADRAGRELLIVDTTEICYTDSHPMIASNTSQNGSNQRQSRQQGFTALKHASEKLNDALDSQYRNLGQSTSPQDYYTPTYMPNDYTIQDWGVKRQVSVSVASITSDEAPETLSVSRLMIHSSPTDRTFESTPPFRPTLPSLHISNSSLSRTHRRQDSISDSPSLADSMILPQSADPAQTLPRLQNLLSPPHSIQSPELKQSLPSLETALRQLKDGNEGRSADASTIPPRLSPVQQSPHNPITVSQSRRPSASLSPPRFSSNSAAWRTLSQNSSNSNSSDAASGRSSHSASTPAARQSPPHSTSTPQSHYQVSEPGSNPDSDMMLSNPESGLQFDPNIQVMPGQQGYVCTFPSCTAAPFQTQYLLNSHQNVHSNQRPHFCPVEGCPRGPSGQGFKRKNEMIRYVAQL